MIYTQDITAMLADAPRPCGWGVKVYSWMRERRLPMSHQINIAKARAYLRELSPLAQGSTRDIQSFYYTIRAMDPLVFEELVLEALFLRGFHIKRGRRYSGDGGIDGWVRLPAHGKKLWVPIQCKRYREHINPEHVRTFTRLVADSGYPAGLFVHTGKTGPASRASANDVFFISGQKLLDLLSVTKRSPTDKPVKIHRLPGKAFR